MNKFFLIFALFSISTKSLLASDFSETVKRLIPSVVQIYGKANPEMVKETVSEDYVNSSNGVVSIGTGFFISSNGLIATAYHVVHPMTDDIFVKSPYGHYTVIAKSESLQKS
jgi:S1-C subfamily serine protease